MKRFLFLLFLIIFGCKVNQLNKTIIVIKGSDTMVNLSEAWAIEFMKKHPDISIQINGGGSGIGIASLLNKTGQIANVSRELKKSEIEEAIIHKINPIKHIVALDAIAIIVNKNNKIDSLDIEQLRKIYTGEIKNWKEVGGDEGKIILFGRENSSGTHEFFKSVILVDRKNNLSYDFSTSVQVLQGTSSLVEAIANDKNAIGYGSLGYFVKRSEIKILKIQRNKGESAYNLINNGQIDYNIIWSGKYPLSRYLFCYTADTNNAAVNKYLSFAKSAEGQELVKKMEYIPLPYEYKQ